MNRTIYHLEFKRKQEHYYSFNLTALLRDHLIGTSLANLRNHDFAKPFENNICIIRLSEITNSKRTRKNEQK